MDEYVLSQIEVLKSLLAHREPQSQQTTASRTGRSVAEVVTALADLRAAGCEIIDEPHRGLRLVATGLGCWVDFIEQRHVDALGRRLVAYRTTTSTQDVARMLVSDATARDHAGTVVTSDHQTAGRGRMGRQWFDSAGASLAFTAIVDPADAAPDRLCLAACCAIADAINETAHIDAAIRWPNDLLLDGRKLAGILVETVGRYALIGVGVNVGKLDDSVPDDDAGRPIVATSLAEAGANVDRLTLLDAALSHLHRTLHETADDELRTRWRNRCGLLNERVAVDAAGSRLTGRVIDIDPQQGLVLEVERGPVVALPAATTSIVVD